MEGQDVALRNSTYGLLRDLGRAPEAKEVADATGLTVSNVRAGWRRLDDAHALVLEAPGDELRMLNPFSAVPTAYRVRAAGRTWFAPCGWDAFGICAALDSDGAIESSCPDCGEGIAIEVRGGRPDLEGVLFHCLVPAAHWWDDIGFT
jgi:hypothetical protein